MSSKHFSLIILLLSFLLLFGVFISINFHIFFDGYQYTHWDVYNYLLTLKHNIENFNNGVIVSGWMPYRQIGEHQYFEMAHGVNVVYQIIGFVIYKVIRVFNPAHNDFYSIYFLQQLFLYFFIYVLGMFFLVNRNITNLYIRVLCYILSVFGTHYVTMFHSFQFGALFHPYLCLFLFELRKKRIPLKYSLIGTIISFFLCASHDHTNLLTTFIFIFLVCNLTIPLPTKASLLSLRKMSGMRRNWLILFVAIFISLGIIAPLLYFLLQYFSGEMQLLSGKLIRDYYNVTNTDPSYVLQLPMFLKSLFNRAIYDSVDIDQFVTYLYYGNIITFSSVFAILFMRGKKCALLITAICVVLIPSYIPGLNPVKFLFYCFNPFFAFGSRHLNSILVYAAPIIILWVGYSYEQILTFRFAKKERCLLIVLFLLVGTIYILSHDTNQDLFDLPYAILNIVLLGFLFWLPVNKRLWVMPLVLISITVELCTLYYTENFTIDLRYHDQTFRKSDPAPIYERIDEKYMGINMPTVHSFPYTFSNYFENINDSYHDAGLFYYIIPSYHFIDPFSFTDVFTDFYVRYDKIYSKLKKRILLTSNVVALDDTYDTTKKIFDMNMQDVVSSVGPDAEKCLEKKGISVWGSLENNMKDKPAKVGVLKKLVIHPNELKLFKNTSDLKLYRFTLPVIFPKYINTNVFNVEYKHITLSLGNEYFEPIYFDRFEKSFQFQVSYQIDRELILSLKDIVSAPIILEWRDLFAEDNIEIKHFDFDNLLLETNFNEPKFLTYMDRNDPHWRATIDNIPTEIIPSNLIFKGLAIPKGKHVVHFEYYDIVRKIFIWWAFFSQLVGMLIVFCLVAKLFKNDPPVSN